MCVVLHLFTALLLLSAFVVGVVVLSELFCRGNVNEDYTVNNRDNNNGDDNDDGDSNGDVSGDNESFLADSAYPKIGCTAQLHKTAKQYRAGEALIFSSIHCNYGASYDAGYDAVTGTFTVPVAGDYIVHATALTMNKNPCYLSIMHGNKVISTGISTYRDKAYYAVAVAHAVLQLQEGETLWVSNQDPNTLWMEGSFSVGIL